MSVIKPFSVTFIISIKGKTIEDSNDATVTTAPMILDKILNKIISQLQEYVARRFLGSFQVSIQTETEVKAQSTIEDIDEFSFVEDE